VNVNSAAQHNYEHRRLEVERSFCALLERSGSALEELDVISASRLALGFFCDVRFDWTKAGEDSDAYSASIFLEREASVPVNPLLALFSKPKPSPLESIVLNFDRVLTTIDDAFIHWSLDVEFDPNGLETLEEIDIYSDTFNAFEDFARTVLMHPSFERLVGCRPRSVLLTTEQP
jgi:hypothetical protein